jgi:alpha-tubulin suppressor-like RCC1 family protein
LGISKEGNLYTWGWNYFGQLGRRDGTHAEGDFALIQGGTRAAAGGMSFSYALLEDGTLLSCGRNDQWVLGHKEDPKGGFAKVQIEDPVVCLVVFFLKFFDFFVL